ncbi:MAG: hypothetical protein QMD61_05645 [Methanobacterium sp.]|nr:hypothetical protein [Methanobacterium sp.]
MLAKNIFSIFLILIFVFGILNSACADSGPNIGANQAKSIAQNYLNSHKLPYKAVTPGLDNWQVKVKDTKTGETKWIPFNVAKEDSPDFGGPGRYEWIEGINSTWIVHVNDNSGKSVGKIYVDSETGKITGTELRSPHNAHNASNNSTDSNQTDNVTTQTSPASSSGNNTGIILGIIVVLVIVGAGYWMYSRR